MAGRSLAILSTIIAFRLFSLAAPGAYSELSGIASAGFAPSAAPSQGPPVSVISIHPDRSFVSGGVATIRGSNLGKPSTTTVRFGVTNATVLGITGDQSTLYARIPPAAEAGLVDVAVTTASGGAALSKGFNYVGLPPAPVLISMTPATATPGSTVTINGTGFSTTPSDNLVLFFTSTRFLSQSGKPYFTNGKVTSASANALQVLVPGQAETGPVSIILGSDAFVQSSGRGWNSPVDLGGAQSNALQLSIRTGPFPATRGIFFRDGGGGQHGMAVVGSQLFRVSNSTAQTVLEYFDLSDPAHPVLQGSIYPLLGAITGLVSSGETLIAYLSSSHLTLIDVHVPGAPKVTSYLSIPRVPINCLAVSGSLVFVATQTSPSQVIVIDISDRTGQKVVGTLDLGYANLATGSRPRTARALAAQGSTLAVGTSTGIVLIDTSNPAAPAIVGALEEALALVGFGDPPVPAGVTGVALSGNTLVAQGHWTYLTVDITDRTQPRPLATFGTCPGRTPNLPMYMVGSVMVAANFEKGVLIADITDPTQPIVISDYDTPTTGGISDVLLAGDFVYASEPLGYPAPPAGEIVHAIQFRGVPSQPIPGIIAAIPSTASEGSIVTLRGVNFGDEQAVRSVTIGGEVAEILTVSPTRAWKNGMATDMTIRVPRGIALDDSGSGREEIVAIVDGAASDPAGITIRRQPVYPFRSQSIYPGQIGSGIAAAVIGDGPYAGVLLSSSDLAIVNVETGERISMLSYPQLGEFRPNAIASTAELMVIKDSSLNRIAVLDVSNPFDVSVLSTLDLLDGDLFATGIAPPRMVMHGSAAYFAVSTGGTFELIVVDLADPRKPKLLNSFDSGESSREFQLFGSGLAIHGNRLAFVTPQTMRLLDISNPSHLQVLGQLTAVDAGAGVAFGGYVAMDGNRLIGSGAFGPIFIDAANPKSPRFVTTISSFTFPSDTQDIVILGQRAFTKAGVSNFFSSFGDLIEIDISDFGNPKVVGSTHTPGTSAFYLVKGGSGRLLMSETNDFPMSLQVFETAPNPPAKGHAADSGGTR